MSKYDTLPLASLATLLATAYLRLLETEREGGAS